ncbi:unnamed protein product [Mytilus coruscus]|uniref:Uncharacterized protein n=1 Tax=Mytilus coruscus TaxID=42192 RepID=A0A6J8AE02_MYTCO|nr:unnamed protein product [Mytilus coruscus]
MQPPQQNFAYPRNTHMVPPVPPPAYYMQTQHHNLAHPGNLLLTTPLQTIPSTAHLQYAQSGQQAFSLQQRTQPSSSNNMVTHPNSSNNMSTHITKPSVVPPSVNLQPSYQINGNTDKRRNNGKNTSRKSNYLNTRFNKSSENYPFLHSTKMASLNLCVSS